MAEHQRSRRISSAAYQALRDALPVIVWYKKSFATFLRTALREHPELLLGLDFDALKRDTADALVDKLIRHEEAYQHVTLRLMLEVAALDSFPELERLEDRATLVAKARNAVANLKAHTESHEELLIERERAEAAREAYSQQAALQRHFSDELNELKNTFYVLAALPDEKSQERGRRFERFLNQLFDLFDLEPRLTYILDYEQIDGAFSFDTDDYIIEAKWTKDKTDIEDANHFAVKVGDKGKNALGLMVSVNGFTQAVVDRYSRGTPFMTIDHSDLMCVLDQRARLDDILRRKKRHANETGECYFPVTRLFE